MLDLSGAEKVAESGPDELRRRLIPADAALDGWPDCQVAGDDTDRFCGGQPVPCTGAGSGLVRVYGPGDRFLGIGELTGEGMVAPRRIFLSNG